jgi:adenylate cyclase
MQLTGGGIFALFGAPLAHEDPPQRALYAALGMQQELRLYGERLGSSEDYRLTPVLLEERVGVNRGEVVMRSVQTGGRVEYTPVGYVTNLAARLQTVVPAGGIAIGEETRRLGEGYFELRALGPTAIKGVAKSASVFEVIEPGPLRTHFQLSARRGLTKFVGREQELAQLKRTLELAPGVAAGPDEANGHGGLPTGTDAPHWNRCCRTCKRGSSSTSSRLPRVLNTSSSTR